MKQSFQSVFFLSALLLTSAAVASQQGNQPRKTKVCERQFSGVRAVLVRAQQIKEVSAEDGLTGSKSPDEELAELAESGGRVIPKIEVITADSGPFKGPTDSQNRPTQTFGGLIEQLGLTNQYEMTLIDGKEVLGDFSYTLERNELIQHRSLVRDYLASTAHAIEVKKQMYVEAMYRHPGVTKVDITLDLAPYPLGEAGTRNHYEGNRTLTELTEVIDVLAPRNVRNTPSIMEELAARFHFLSPENKLSAVMMTSEIRALADLGFKVTNIIEGPENRKKIWVKLEYEDVPIESARPAGN